MSYQGMEITNKENYIFDDTEPYNPEFDLEELKIIQTKLENFTSGRSINGITSQEAEIFLDWVTFNARNYAVRNIPESAMTASMTGQCAPTQRINLKLLSRLGLDVRAFNTADCIGEIPMNDEDLMRMQNGWSSTNVRHSISLVNIPIIDNNGNTQSYKFLLDPTFRQFCLKENCDGSKFVDESWLGRGHVAPHTGYFMEADNLKQLGVSEETAQKSEMLGKYIVSKGYFYLNEENAKLYGDAFVRASKRLEFQNAPIYTTGEEYIRNFENIPMQIIGNDKSDMQFTKLPSEIADEKQGIFLKIINFFKNKFRNKQKMLPEGNFNKKMKNSRIHNALDNAKLSEKDLAQFRTEETKILSKYNDNIEHNNIEHNNIEHNSIKNDEKMYE